MISLDRVVGTSLSWVADAVGPAAPSDDHFTIIVNALVYGVIASGLSLIGVIIVARNGRRVDVTPPTTPTTNVTPPSDVAYRKVLDDMEKYRKERDAARIMLGRLGINPLKVRHGWEVIEDVRNPEPPAPG